MPEHTTLPENLIWTETSPGNRRAVLSHRPELMLVAFSFDKGAIGALHSHPHTQVSYVAKGVFRSDGRWHNYHAAHRQQLHRRTKPRPWRRGA